MKYVKVNTSSVQQRYKALNVNIQGKVNKIYLNKHLRILARNTLKEPLLIVKLKIEACSGKALKQCGLGGLVTRISTSILRGPLGIRYSGCLQTQKRLRI